MERLHRRKIPPDRRNTKKMKTNRILFLCYRVSQGFGVEAVILEQAYRLQKRGHEIHIACVELAQKPLQEITYHELLPGFTVLTEFINSIRPNVIIAHTEPWMSLLAQIKPSSLYQRWIWEHGDPTPELIPLEKEARQLAKSHKTQHVYGNVDKVFAISEFVRKDIAWPQATVVYNGCPTLIHKSAGIKAYKNPVLHVGSLMRMGTNEALYKGAEHLLSVASLCKTLTGNKNIRFSIMGRGREADANRYKDLGFDVFLNATEEEKYRFLSEIDVLLSPSQWEGFNLPLIEAQTIGTHAIAFDVAAHPEVCPFVFSSINEMAHYLTALSLDKTPLIENSQISQRFVKRRFSYESAVKNIEAHAIGSKALPSSVIPSRTKLLVIGIKEGVRMRGFLGFGFWFLKKTVRKLLKRA